MALKELSLLISESKVIIIVALLVAVYCSHHHGNDVRVPLLPDRPQGEAIQLCLFHQASAVLPILAALLPVDDRDRDIFAMLK